MALALSSGCGLLTEPASGNVADLRGDWNLAGSQAAPALTLTGTFSISSQQGAEVFGTAQWEERDGVGNVVLRGGPLSGLVLSAVDVDFDVQLAGQPRRFVGVLRADTLSGTWVQTSGNLTGSFRAVRSGTP